MLMTGADHVDAEGLLAELDEMVDAANSLASVVGLEPGEDGANGPNGARSSP